MVRVIFPTVTENGFGNNIITLAKAHLIAKSCNLTYQAPVWPYCPHVKPASPNGYGHYFPSTRTDKLKLNALKLLFRVNRRLKSSIPISTLTYGVEDYKQSGIVDVGEACRVYLQQRGLESPSRSLVLTVEGMWGNYLPIKRARNWITHLLSSHANTAQRFEAIRNRVAGKLRIAVHIRMGDFVAREAAGVMKPGERAVRLPMEWYIRVCQQIREHVDANFILLSDGKPEELKPFLDAIRPTHILGEPYQDLLGILLLRESDLIVASNSTYSRLGAFLNDKPYIWPADTLHRDSSGKFGYLWKGLGSAVPSDDRSDPDVVRRCYALAINSPQIPGGLIKYLRSNGTARIEFSEDLLYSQPVYILR